MNRWSNADTADMHMVHVSVNGNARMAPKIEEKIEIEEKKFQCV